jgi:threonine/homoserine/homoserine lactone efflux protein
VLLQAAELLVVLNYVWPLAVIGGGAYLLWSAWRRRRIEHDPTNSQGAPTETSTR